jgi:hypothetical protein
VKLEMHGLPHGETGLNYHPPHRGRRASPDCECTTDGADEFDDLTLKFSNHALIESLGLVSNGDELVLAPTAGLFDGPLIEGAGCVIIRATRATGGRRGPRCLDSSAVGLRWTPK